MYSNATRGNVLRMNYYVPIKEAEHMQADNASAFSIDTSPDNRRTTRILGRKYALTATSYKYLEIGISVKPVSEVEILLGDNRGNQLILSHYTWMDLMLKQMDINRLLQSAETSPFWIRDLAVEICMMKHTRVVKLSLFKKSLYLTPATLDTLFNLEYCINHMYSWLRENTCLVDDKFGKFVEILRGKASSGITCTPNEAARDIRESAYFDCGSLVDCELLACALPDIMRNAFGK